MLLKPDTALEWALALALGALALAAPVALVVWMWPAITSGLFGPAVFFLALALGLFISAGFLWLFTPLVVGFAGLAAGLAGAARGLLRWLRT